MLICVLISIFLESSVNSLIRSYIVFKMRFGINKYLFKIEKTSKQTIKFFTFEYRLQNLLLSFFFKLSCCTKLQNFLNNNKINIRRITAAGAM